MKRQVMQPFRAPRKGKAQSSPTRQSPRRVQKQDQEVHVVPYIKGIRMMSDREATECAQHGEVLRWSSESEGEIEETLDKTNAERQLVLDSEEDTALGLVYPQRIIPETQYGDIEKLSFDGNLDNNDIGNQVLIVARANRSPESILKQAAISSTVPSPNLSEFEAFLDRASANSAMRENKGNKAGGSNKANSKSKGSKKDNQPLTSEAVEALVPVGFMLLDEHRNDNDVPIVSATSSSLSLLVDAATQQVASPHLRKKKAPKVRRLHHS